MKTFFTSDTHFGHDNIIRYCNRPFVDSVEMDEALIERWNSRVGKDDHVWHLGDFGFGKRATSEYLAGVISRLNGYKHIVWGNHDKEAVKVEDLFSSWWNGLKEIEVNKQKIVLCHYPMRSWHHNMRGAWHLFGHCHGTVKPFGKSFDVGVDSHDFYPLSFEEVKAKMDAMEQKVEEFGFTCNKCQKFPCVCPGADASSYVPPVEAPVTLWQAQFCKCFLPVAGSTDGLCIYCHKLIRTGYTSVVFK